MPVDLLYCEGGKNSPDLRVLLNVLRGVCTVKYSGSKYGFDRKIIFIRQENLSPSIVAALKDRDFDEDESQPVNSPRYWLARDNQENIQVGWTWERKEIENYLIDPTVVQYALGSKAPPMDDYRAELENSAQTIADYTAARIALSLSRRRLLPLNNSWGNAGINRNHSFPESLLESDCREGIKNIVNQYEQSQIVREDDVLDSFDRLLSTCRVGGCRFKDYLTFFSGKDLLYGMRTALADFSLGEPSAFLERVVKGIENSTDVWTWLPEWNQLRQMVQQFSPR